MGRILQWHLWKGVVRKTVFVSEVEIQGFE